MPPIPEIPKQPMSSKPIEEIKPRMPPSISQAAHAQPQQSLSK
jgi:hypothetical protein